MLVRNLSSWLLGFGTCCVELTLVGLWLAGCWIRVGLVKADWVFCYSQADMVFLFSFITDCAIRGLLVVTDQRVMVATAIASLLLYLC
jgi:hypothetical protein